MYKFDINSNKKAIVVTVEGFFKEDEVKSYMADFQATINKVTPSTHYLIVDGRKQAVVAQNLKDELQAAIDFYVSVGFKGVFITELESVTANSQVKRLNNIDKITIVKTPEEAMAQI